VVEVVLQTEVPLLGPGLAWTLVVPLIDALHDAAIDQYRTLLVESYRCEVVQTEIDGADLLPRTAPR
jgi:hypothetical protein